MSCVPDTFKRHHAGHINLDTVLLPFCASHLVSRLRVSLSGQTLRSISTKFSAYSTTTPRTPYVGFRSFSACACVDLCRQTGKIQPLQGLRSTSNALSRDVVRRFTRLWRHRRVVLAGRGQLSTVETSAVPGWACCSGGALRTDKEARLWWLSQRVAS